MHQPATDRFFFGGGSLFGPRPIHIQILMPSPYYFLPELAFTDRIVGALHTGAHLSFLRHCLQGRHTLFSLKGEPTFCHSVCEMAPLSPSDADFVFSDIGGDHSAPVIWAGFHRRVFLPSTFCHSVCEMAPHDSPKRYNNNRFGEFSFSLRPVYGRGFSPRFSFLRARKARS